MALRRAAWLGGPLRQAMRGISIGADKTKNNAAALREPTQDAVKRRSTVFGMLEEKGMVVGEVNNGVSSMQRALWFKDENKAQMEKIEEEYFACRNNAAIWDMSSFVKLRISGPDACKELEHLCSLKIDRPVSEGRLVYCCLCQEDGGVAADVTVLRTGEEEFYMVVGAELLRHVLGYLRTHIRAEAKVTVTDISDSVGVICCAGPTSRKVLSEAAPLADFSNDSFPFATAKRLEINGVPVLALRVNFMGDLGWELHCDMDNLPVLYDSITAAGSQFGVTDAGYACLANLRTEKMFLHWGPTMRVGVELTAAETPLHLGFPVKKTPFIASEAIKRQRKAGVNKRLVTMQPIEESEIRFQGHEKLIRDGQEAGIVSTTAYSYGLRKPIAVGWIERDEPAPWSWVNDEDAVHHIQMHDGTLVPCKLSSRSAFDPEGVRMRS